MASLNKVFIIGNLTQEPELRYTQSGQAVVTLNVASNRKFKTHTGELKEDTLFIRIEAWGKMAENCGEYLSKGSPILVEGRLVQDNWETKEGQKRTTYKVSASNIQFLPSGRKSAGSSSNSDKDAVDGESQSGAAGKDESNPDDTIPDDIPF